MKRATIAVLCIICVLFTGCNSLFLGNTEVVLVRQEEFFPSSQYAYQNAQTVSLTFTGQGEDAFYINPYHSKDPEDLLYFECLDMLGESTLLYGYQTIIREPQEEEPEDDTREIVFETELVDGTGVLRAYEIIRDENGNEIRREDVTEEFGSAGSTSASAGSQVTPVPSQTPDTDSDESLSPTPSPSPTPTPTPVPPVKVSAEDGSLLSEEEEISVEKNNIGKMVTQFVAYNFKTREAHIIFKHITDASEVQSLYLQELPNPSEGWDKDYLLYFNRICYFYRFRTGDTMQSELYSQFDAGTAINGAYAWIQADTSKELTLKNVCVTGQGNNDRIHLSTMLEIGEIDENTEIDEDIDESTELPEDMYSQVGIRIQLEFPERNDIWFERQDDESTYRFINTSLDVYKDNALFTSFPMTRDNAGNWLVSDIQFHTEYVSEWISGVVDRIEDVYEEAPPIAPVLPDPPSIPTGELTPEEQLEVQQMIIDYQNAVENFNEEYARYEQEYNDYQNRKENGTLDVITRTRSTMTDSADYAYEQIEGYTHTGVRVCLRDGASCFLIRYINTMSTTAPYYNSGRIVYADNKAYVLDQDAEITAFYNNLNGIGEIPTDNTTVHTYVVADSELSSVSQMPEGAAEGLMAFSKSYIYLVKQGTLSEQHYYNTELNQKTGNGTAIRIPYSEIWDPIERTEEVYRESTSTVTPDETANSSDDTTISQRTDENGNPIDLSGVNTGKSDSELLDGLPSVNMDNSQTNSSGVGGSEYFNSDQSLEKDGVQAEDVGSATLEETDPAEIYSVKNFIIREEDIIITSRYCGIIVYRTGTNVKVERVHEGSFYQSFLSSKSGFYVAIGYPDTNVNYQEYDIINAKAYEYTLDTQELKVGIVGNGVNTPLAAIADTLGYFREEGLTATVTSFASIEEGLAALESGTIEVLVNDSAEAIVKGAAQGKGYTIIGGMDADRGVLISTQEYQNRIFTVSDLAGHTVAGVGTDTGFLAVRDLAQNAGLDAETEFIGYESYEEVIEAVAEGTAQVGIVKGEYGLTAEQTEIEVQIELGSESDVVLEGSTNYDTTSYETVTQNLIVLRDVSEWVSDMPGGIVTVMGSKLGGKQEALIKFEIALLRAYLDVAQYHTTSAQNLAEYTGMTAESTEYALYSDGGEVQPAPLKKQLGELYQILGRAGEIPETSYWNLNSNVDMTVYKAALDEMLIRYPTNEIVQELLTEYNANH